jgi:hypothetical protein
VHLMHPAAQVHKGHYRSGGPLDARVASSRFHVVAQSRCPDDGQVGDMKNSVVSPSDTFHSTRNRSCLPRQTRRSRPSLPARPLEKMGHLRQFLATPEAGRL